MPKHEIDRATAKDELARINNILCSPYLLIGGLAVQQYDKSRISKDIDLICDFATIQGLLESLYPSLEWEISDHTDDDYRPAYHIKHRHSDQSEIVFGPKVKERGNYEFLNWAELGVDAQPFMHKNISLPNILVPLPHALAYSKLVSVVGRQELNEEKIKKDLHDFSSLTNHELFSLAKFWNLLNRHDTLGSLRERFRDRSSRFPDVLKKSCLHSLTNLFSGPKYLSLEQLGILEGSVPNLVRVMVVADRIEKPEGSLGQAVEGNFAKKVEYLFLVSGSTAANEKEGYYKIFEAYQQIKSPGNKLVDIKALPFEWDDYPIIFYQCKGEDNSAVIAFRGSGVKEGITTYYERVPSEYAHTIAKSLLADAPKDVDIKEIPGRNEFDMGNNIQLNNVLN